MLILLGKLALFYNATLKAHNKLTLLLAPFQPGVQIDFSHLSKNKINASKQTGQLTVVKMMFYQRLPNTVGSTKRTDTHNSGRQTYSVAQ